jgi:hypothetical protein
MEAVGRNQHLYTHTTHFAAVLLALVAGCSSNTLHAPRDATSDLEDSPTFSTSDAREAGTTDLALDDLAVDRSTPFSMDLAEDRYPPLLDVPSKIDLGTSIESRIADTLPSPDAIIDAADPATLCTSTGGRTVTQMCCIINVMNFPDSCTPGAVSCTCQPAQSTNINICVCPSGACFLSGTGCVGPASTCTVGQDQSCNDDPTIGSYRGICLPSGRCRCSPGSALNSTTGKCQ